MGVQVVLLGLIFAASTLAGGPLGCSSIGRSAARGDVEAVKVHLAKGKNIESPDWKRRSPLELAIILEQQEMIDLLIAEGANVNRQGKGSRTPLIWASMRWGSPELIDQLVDAGADPNGTDKGGQTPLLFAVLYGTPAQAETLLRRGADINHHMAPKWNSAVLSVAIRQKKIEFVEFLVASGADVEARDSRGRTAREQATRRPGMSYAIDHGLKSRNTSTAVASTTAGMRSSPMSATSSPSTSTAPAKSPAPIATSTASKSKPASRPTPTQEAPPQTTARVAPSQTSSSPSPAPKVEPARPPRASQQAPVVPRPIPLASMTPRQSSKGLRLGDYYALIIGNDDYEHLPKLKTAVNDANALSVLLRDRYGYHVNTLLNASRSEILQALAKYRRILDADDNLLIYYAGHGWLDEDADRGYWLPIDATQDDDVHWIANESISSKTRAIEAKHVMVIADSCYSGKLVRGIHVNQNTPNYLKRLATRRARVVLTSGGIEPVSDSGGRDNHSVFAAALLRALEENDGVLEGHELFTKVRRPVAVNSDQIPEYSDIRKAGHDGGDFLFIVP